MTQYVAQLVFLRCLFFCCVEVYIFLNLWQLKAESLAKENNRLVIMFSRLCPFLIVLFSKSLLKGVF